MYVKEVSVLGGGTAGLTTALILRSAFPSLKINFYIKNFTGPYWASVFLD